MTQTCLEKDAYFESHPEELSCIHWAYIGLFKVEILVMLPWLKRPPFVSHLSMCCTLAGEAGHPSKEAGAGAGAGGAAAQRRV